MHEHLLRLLSPLEQEELQLSTAFIPFVGLHPLQPNPYTEPLWKAAVSQYERCMAPTEQRISSKALCYNLCYNLTSIRIRGENCVIDPLCLWVVAFNSLMQVSHADLSLNFLIIRTSSFYKHTEIENKHSNKNILTQ